MRDALPNASFIGFTGTPIELSDRNTPALFGDYIDIYDLTQAVEDKTTVPIYYESRIAKLDILPEIKSRSMMNMKIFLKDKKKFILKVKNVNGQD